jgi:transposase InsO family protein
MMNAGVFVNNERRIAHIVVLPRAFSAKMSVKRRNVTSPKATQFLKRPTFLIEILDKDGIADDIHLFNDKLRKWEDYHNYHRPHGALDGQTPYERLLAKTGASVSPAS